MGIAFLEKEKLFKIDTPRTSYCIGITDEEQFLTHVYYGASVSDDDLSYLLRIQEAPFVPSVNGRDRSSFLDSCPLEFPGQLTGDYRESAIGVEDENGNCAVQLTYKGYRILDGKKALTGLPATFEGEAGKAKTLEIDVEDEVLSLCATISYSVFEDNDAILRSVKVINEGNAPIALTKILSVSLDMDAKNYELLTLHGSWARERKMDFRPIAYGKQGTGSLRGESSHQGQPFVGLVSQGDSQENGEVYGFHLIYSGNYIGQAEKSQFDSLRISLGIHPEQFKFILQPGDSFQAPEAAMVYSGSGLGQMSRAYHDLYRDHLIRSAYKNKPRPILINNWEATYFNFNTEKLLSIAREAKKSGIEMLVMDDGWFGYRNDDNTSLGDWQVNEEKLGSSLKELVDAVNDIGLQFGIWFEPEMISPDSNLYRAHPDWAIAIPGRKPCLSRNQYVLDLSRQEVRDYAYGCVKKILESANIAYVKWDMNRQLTDLGSAFLGKENQGELLHRYTLGVYEMQERLITDFPNLLLENCSGGGARFDPGMLYYSPQIWCSDDADAIERLSIQEGTSLLMPLSTMGAHVADCPNHSVGRSTPFATRGNVALAGTFGYELDITKIDPKERAQIPGQTKLYHAYHELICTGDYYRIASYQRNHFYDAYEVVAKDKSEALVTFVQVLGRPNVHSRIIRVPGLDPKSLYRIQVVNCSDSGADWNGVEGQVLHGDTLGSAGLLVKNMWGDFHSVLFHLTRQ